MENGQSATISAVNESTMMPLNQKDQVRNHRDIMMRRLKNRERQRRYRARKRLEADIKRTQTSPLLQHLEADMEKAHTTTPLTQQIPNAVSQRRIKDQLTPAQVQMPVNGYPLDFATRVHCRRDWKKDARRAHSLKEQEVKSDSHVVPELTSVSGSQISPFPSGIKVDSPLANGGQSSAPLDGGETRKILPSRRHWKAEARNKKS